MKSIFVYQQEALNDLLLFGYARNCDFSNRYIPNDVINLCIQFYQDLKEKFEHYNPQIYQLLNNDTCVKRVKTNPDSATVYGNLGILSCSPSIHQWTFKINLERYNGSSSWNGFGIDEIRHIRKNKGYFNYYHGESKLYGLWSDGEVVEWNCDDYMVKRENLTFTKGDIIVMKLDLYSNPKTLSYGINGEAPQIVFNNVYVGEDVTYCMAMCMYSAGRAALEYIELLSYSSELFKSRI